MPRVLRLLRLVVFLLAAASVVGVTAPTASPPARPIAPGVTVVGMKVGRMTSEPARARIAALLDRRVRFRLASRRWTVAPGRFGVSASVDRAVTRALAAPARARLELPVALDGRAVRRYAARLARKHFRPAVDAHLTGVDSSLRPVISDERAGTAVKTRLLERVIAAELRRHWRNEIVVPMRPVLPRVTSEDYGPVIVINRGTNTLSLYDGTSPWRTFRVATGSARYPTPAGTWHIVDKQRNPWWRPPDSDWAEGKKPIPPGPGNPLGTRWMGLDAAAVGIHGTPDAASLGYSVSHGCIRMQVPEAEWLFEQVDVGTHVVVV